MHTVQEVAQIGWEAYREREARAPLWGSTDSSTKEMYERMVGAVLEWRQESERGGEEFAKHVFFASCVEWNGTKEQLWQATPQKARNMLKIIFKRMLRATRSH